MKLLCSISTILLLLSAPITHAGVSHLEAKKPCIAPIYAIYRAKDNNVRVAHFLDLLKASQVLENASTTNA